MRPFRALALVAVGLAFWVGMRAERLRYSIDAVLADRSASELPAAPASSRPATPAYAPADSPMPQPVMPEVQVYSYPAEVVAPPPPPARSRRPTLPPGAVWADDLSPSPVALARAQPLSALPPERIRPPEPQAAAPDLSRPAYEAATRAYALLRAGDRRGAAQAFAVALSMAPDHPRARAWATEKRRLARWWRAEAYVFVRNPDGRLIASRGLPSASPVLGSGQFGATLAVTPAPYARRRLEAQLRVTIPQDGPRLLEPAQTQGALGIAFQPVPRVPVGVAVERLFKLSSNARNDWQARLYGGTAARWRGLDLSAFGEGGVVGRRPDLFAGLQTTAERSFALPGGFDAGLGVGAWGAVQSSDRLSTRLDLGPTLRLSRARAPLALRVDYRARVAGNARPGSGVALTVTSRY